MPKRRRIFTPNKHKIKGVVKTEVKVESDTRDREVSSARGRFRGALKGVLDPTPQSEESEHSSDERNHSDKREDSSDEEYQGPSHRSPPRQSYVLKLFDRSVDLSQFRDDSPLYPICRAWMLNQPKAKYSETCTTHESDFILPGGGVDLPGPEGELVPKIPDLLVEQLNADKDNINLNYAEAPPPTREQLLRMHMPRWAAIKQAWQDQITNKEARYEGTQRILNKINQDFTTR